MLLQSQQFSLLTCIMFFDLCTKKILVEIMAVGLSTLRIQREFPRVLGVSRHLPEMNVMVCGRQTSRFVSFVDRVMLSRKVLIILRHVLVTSAFAL